MGGALSNIITALLFLGGGGGNTAIIIVICFTHSYFLKVLVYLLQCPSAVIAIITCSFYNLAFFLPLVKQS